MTSRPAPRLTRSTPVPSAAASSALRVTSVPAATLTTYAPVSASTAPFCAASTSTGSSIAAHALPNFATVSIRIAHTPIMKIKEKRHYYIPLPELVNAEFHFFVHREGRACRDRAGCGRVALVAP